MICDLGVLLCPHFAFQRYADSRDPFHETGIVHTIKSRTQNEHHSEYITEQEHTYMVIAINPFLTTGEHNYMANEHHSGESPAIQNRD